MFYHHIHTLLPTDPAFRIHTQQRLLPFEKNWTNEVSSLLQIYSLDDIDIVEISKEEWKETVAKSITAVAFDKLVEECGGKTKTYKLTYETLTQQKYLTSLPYELACLVFKIRSRNIKCLNNHHSSSENLVCRLCGSCIETEEHIS